MAAFITVLSFLHAIPGFTQASQDATAQQSTPYQLQMPVPMVVEDVVVLDHSGQPVHGLKASDLTVTENGKPVTLQNFEEHSFSPQQQVPVPPDLGPNAFTNMEPAPATDSLNVLLFDALNTPMTDQAEMRQQMLDYLKTLPPGLPIAVFGLGNQLYMLQGFTTDPKVLAAAIEASQKMIHSSPRLDNPVSDAPNPKMSDFVAQTTDQSDPAVQLMVANMRQFELENGIAQTAQRVQYTMQALNELARYLAGLPGRKNVIWFSGSFPMNFIPDEMQANPFMAVADFQDDVRKTMDLLARNEVAVYPVDGRGLFNNPAFSAESSHMLFGVRSSAPTKGPGMAHSPAPREPNAAYATQQFTRMTEAEHVTMNVIAENTGGKAYVDSNGLKEAVEDAIKDGSNYYTLTYSPPDRKFDGSYRHIEVKIDQPGLRLSYRKAYFADNPNEPWSGKKVLAQTAMQAAMMRGGPAETQIPFDVQVMPQDALVDKPSMGTKPNGKLMKPPYRRYELTYVVDISKVAFPATPDGVHHGRLEFAALIYSPEGELVNNSSNHINLDVPAEKYTQVLANGLRVGQTIEGPPKGDYFLRLGIYDFTGDRVGAMEIPLSTLKIAGSFGPLMH